MIYKRNAAFPYPLLTNDSSAYKDNKFIFDCNLSVEEKDYKFLINYEISSQFLSQTITNDDAGLFLVIDSTDSNFYKLDTKLSSPIVKIPVSSINLSRNINLQLLIKANKDMSFSNNNDLLDFYDNYKCKIIVHEGNALGFSNIITFNGNLKNPIQLFNKRIDSNVKSISYDFNDEYITIVYRNEEYQFNDLNNARNLNNMYIHEGLYRALKRFMDNYLNDNPSISDITSPDNGLDLKIYMLLQAKNIDTLDEDNIDDVIYQITDNIIEKYNTAIRGR